MDADMNIAQARGEAPPIDCASGRISERRISARMVASVSLVRHLLIPNPQQTNVILMKQK